MSPFVKLRGTSLMLSFVLIVFGGEFTRMTQLKYDYSARRAQYR